MYTRRVPFDHIRMNWLVIPEILKGVHPNPPSDTPISNQLWYLMKHCWSQEPQERPPMSYIHEKVILSLTLNFRMLKLHSFCSFKTKSRPMAHCLLQIQVQGVVPVH